MAAHCSGMCMCVFTVCMFTAYGWVKCREEFSLVGINKDCFVRLCSALNRDCTVHQDVDQTIYNISDASRAPGVRGSRCMYTWANRSNHVLANSKEEIPELVTKNTINTLVTSKCFDKLVLTRHCILEAEYTAVCTTNCRENAQLWPDNEIQYSDHSWIAAVVIGLLLVVALPGFLYCRFRTARMCSCSQLRSIYTSVKKQDCDPKADDVEAGKE